MGLGQLPDRGFHSLGEVGGGSGMATLRTAPKRK